MKLRRGRALLVGLVALVSVSSASCANTLEAQSVERVYATQGLQHTLRTYFSCDAYEGSAYERIATGAAPWIALAEKLVVQTDGCYTEGLQAALGEAMRKSPGRVLALVNTTPALGAEYICLPFISSEQPVEVQLHEIAVSRRAIATVDDVALAPQKAACLRFIDDVTSRLR